MELIAVADKETARQFIEVNVIINTGNPNYVRPLDKDIDGVFDPSVNKALRHAEITRWILKNSQGELIGRVAAFVNKKYKTIGDEVPVGGIGFFDCINDHQAAGQLLDVSKHWLLQRGMGAMDGPINCGERDRWWGLLVEGFHPPAYCTSYNPPYYKDLFERYGFQPFYNQICFAMKVKAPLQQKFFDRHAALAADPALSSRYIDKSKLSTYAADFATVYNKAWAGHGGLKQVNKEMVLKMFRQMKPVMDEKVIWFTYYKEEPIGIWVNLPDLNEWFRHLNGDFGLWSKLKFLWLKSTVKCHRFIGLVFGVVPEWQGKGLDSYMIVEGAKIIQHKLHYEEYEMQWIGEFNPRMINVATSLGTYRSRKLITYRCLFDQSKEFHPHPIF